MTNERSKREGVRRTVEIIRRGARYVASVTHGELLDLCQEALSHMTMFDGKAAWSLETFGPGNRLAGLLEHIRRELVEIEKKPDDLEEWIDVVLLAMDGAWRCAGADGATFVAALHEKYEKNIARAWPDWRTQDPNAPIEHVRRDDLNARLVRAVEFAKQPRPTAPTPASAAREVRTEDSLRTQLAEMTADRDRWVERNRTLEAKLNAIRHVVGT